MSKNESTSLKKKKSPSKVTTFCSPFDSPVAKDSSRKSSLNQGFKLDVNSSTSSNDEPAKSKSKDIMKKIQDQIEI